MKPRNQDFAIETTRILSDAPFINDLGIETVYFEPGICETSLELKSKHLQQDGYVHAGVQATIADHTAGAAGSTLIEFGEIVLTAEFKINLLRAAKGNKLICKANVLKPGKRLIIVESEVFCVDSLDNKKLVSKAMVTLATVDKK